MYMLISSSKMLQSASIALMSVVLMVSWHHISISSSSAGEIERTEMEIIMLRVAEKQHEANEVGESWSMLWSAILKQILGGTLVDSENTHVQLKGSSQNNEPDIFLEGLAAEPQELALGAVFRRS